MTTCMTFWSQKSCCQRRCAYRRSSRRVRANECRRCVRVWPSERGCWIAGEFRSLCCARRMNWLEMQTFISEIMKRPLRRMRKDWLWWGRFSSVRRLKRIVSSRSTGQVLCKKVNWVLAGQSVLIQYRTAFTGGQHHRNQVETRPTWAWALQCHRHNKSSHLTSRS